MCCVHYRQALCQHVACSRNYYYSLDFYRVDDWGLDIKEFTQIRNSRFEFLSHSNSKTYVPNNWCSELDKVHLEVCYSKYLRKRKESKALCRIWASKWFQGGTRGSRGQSSNWVAQSFWFGEEKNKVRPGKLSSLSKGRLLIILQLQCVFGRVNFFLVLSLALYVYFTAWVIAGLMLLSQSLLSLRQFKSL